VIPVLDPVIGALTNHSAGRAAACLGNSISSTTSNFARIDAMTFALNHDDGQSSWGLNDADVVLVGVSRTSKTPTCIYLAIAASRQRTSRSFPGVPLPASWRRPRARSSSA